MLDNLLVHKVDSLVQVVEVRMARLPYLLPYLPDFTPIAHAFSKFETWLRTARARPREAREAVI